MYLFYMLLFFSFLFPLPLPLPLSLPPFFAQFRNYATTASKPSTFSSASWAPTTRSSSVGKILTKREITSTQYESLVTKLLKNQALIPESGNDIDGVQRHPDVAEDMVVSVSLPLLLYRGLGHPPLFFKPFIYSLGLARPLFLLTEIPQ